MQGLPPSKRTRRLLPNMPLANAQEQPQQDMKPIMSAEEQPDIGRVGPIGAREVREAETTLKKYKDGKANLDARIVENERWFRLQHWEMMRTKAVAAGVTPDPEPASAWLHNAISNKHADFMDNFPSPNVLPREQGDKDDAELLSSILPVVLEQNDYEQTYDSVNWYKLSAGTGVVGCFWNPSKLNGLGDIEIKMIDILNLFWEPGIIDIQRSRHLFHVELVDKDMIVAKYPFMKDKLSSETFETAKYIYDDTIDTSDKVSVVDWYYKKNIGGKNVLHYCKFAAGEPLYASENDTEPRGNKPPISESGWYNHGEYPFDFDVMFPEKGSPAGFSYIDIAKSPQMYIDKLDQTLLKVAAMQEPRFFVRGDGGEVNEAEYCDFKKKIVHFSGSGNPNDSIFQITPPQINQFYEALRLQKIEELKETSGNRDFSQGSTAGGVTAASAIAALQEAGSKLSRDSIKSAYRSHRKICYFVIELMRQFYEDTRFFRVTGKQGEMQFLPFNGQQIAAKPQGNEMGVDLGTRVPIFDIVVTSQKSSPFSTVAQNERAKELYSLGFFNPEMADQALSCLEMMDFEGIEGVRERISKVGGMFNMIQQLTPLVLMLAQSYDMANNTQFTQQVAQVLGIQMQPQQGALPAPQGAKGEPQTNSLGDTMNQARGATAGGARVQAARNSTPR